MTPGWRVEFLGDAALLVECTAADPFVANAHVHQCARALRRARVAGVRDVVPAMRDLVVHVDPLRCSLAALERALEDGFASSCGDAPAGALHEIPMRYGGDAGPDLALVAASSGLSVADVCQRHCGRRYTVCFVGFLPGFPYLGPLDPALQLPRRTTPRVDVAPGSVALAGEYSGIYPWASPGGWHVIGRTDVALFDMASATPARLAPGDRVQFVQVD